VNLSLEQKVRDHLRRVYELDPEGVQELYEIGHDTVTQTLARMEAAVVAGNLTEMGDAGHMLKGTLFNMGLTEAAEAARALELACKAGKSGEVPDLFARLRSRLQGF